MSSTISNATGRPPPLSNQTLTRVVCKYFSFKSVREDCIKSLPSYDDRNYYFQGECSTSNAHEFVLKLSNPLYTSFEELCGIYNLMNHLHSCDLKFAIPFPLCNRKYANVVKLTYDELTDGNHQTCSTKESSLSSSSAMKDFKYFVSLLTFIPGETLDHVEKKILTPELLFEVGVMIGRVNKELMENFSSKPLELRNNTAWNIHSFLSLKSHLHVIENSERRSMVEGIFKAFEENVNPCMPSFRTGYIHGDANGLNIILSKGSESTYHVTGLIDFGDCNKSCCVFDLGICLAYIMLENLEPLTCSSCVEFVGPIIRGFNSILPLNKEEFDSLYYIVLARCCQSVISGAQAIKAEPWNSYLLTTPSKAWLLMENLTNTPKESIDKIWKSLCYN